MAKLVDMSNLMHTRPSEDGPSLPGVHARRQRSATKKTAAATPTVTENVAVAPEAEETVEATGADSSAEKPKAEAPATKSVKKEPAKKAAKAAPKKATAKKSPAAKPVEKTVASNATDAEPAEANDELTSLDGRPARLWDTSGSNELPEGWGRVAIERVSKASRRFRADRRNTTLPDNIYAACNDFIYQEAKDGGLSLTLSNLAEAAYEQIPHDDVDGITRLLDSLPDQYFEKGLATRPRTFQLFEPTLEHMQNLARMLRAHGFTGKTGLVQTAALRALLVDLGVTVDD